MATKTTTAVFPAHAGMSRGRILNSATCSGFPRPRGDEPAWELYRREWGMFSPPTRG